MAYVPWTLYCLYFNELSIIPTLIFTFIGAFGWTLFEYLAHRFVFHSEDYLPEKRGWYLLHFMIHGIHHSFP